MMPGISNSHDLKNVPRPRIRVNIQLIILVKFPLFIFISFSGLLVAYLTLKEIKKRGGVKKMNWGMFYFHRFWR